MRPVVYSKAAAKALARMQPKRRDAIIASVDAFARGERVDIRKLTGARYYRIRVGQDRVIIDDDGVVLLVLDAGPRGGIYKE